MRKTQFRTSAPEGGKQKPHENIFLLSEQEKRIPAEIFI
jgi:hypothetical protein